MFEQINRVYIGVDETIDILLIALLARGHALLEGVPGIAKTTLVKAFARTIGCSYKRIQFTPDLLPADITGTFVLNFKDNSFELRRGPIFANVVLGDEINRAPAKTQSALLEAMQESQVTIEGHTEPLPVPFMVLATQNPIEQEGVYPLPEAQVDRFMVKLKLGYPTFAQEQRILATYNQPTAEINALLNPDTVTQLATFADGVHIEQGLRDYIVRFSQYTREHPKVMYGASPRASLALLRCSKCRALLHGRNYVLPDDIRALIPYVVAHRVILTPEAELDGHRVGGILDDAIRTIRYAKDGN